MEEGKTTKKMEISRMSRKETRGVDTVVDVPHVNDKRVSSDVAKPSEKA